MSPDVIPKRDKPWWRDWTLVQLNFLLLCALLTQIASGFDASMLNGMQSLNQWTEYFGHPAGARLGAMTVGPVGGTLISIVVSSNAKFISLTLRPNLVSSRVSSL